jgi:hypothetical protein
MRYFPVFSPITFHQLRIALTGQIKRLAFLLQQVAAMRHIAATSHGNGIL